MPRPASPLLVRPRAAPPAAASQAQRPPREVPPALPGQCREIVAALMCSHLYFELAPAERLALVKSLRAFQGRESPAALALRGALLPCAP
ncbi:MAG: hypothetical protein V1806_16575 [Pseudomonadota bacterium]